MISRYEHPGISLNHHFLPPSDFLQVISDYLCDHYRRFFESIKNNAMKTNTISFKKMTVALLLMTSSIAVKAQDTLIYKNGDKRIVHVIETGLDEIKFRNMNDSSDVIRVLEKDQFKEIRLASHEKIEIFNDPMSARFTEKELKKINAIKFDFLGPLFNYISISYERMLQPWMNIEVEAGIIGVGIVSNTEKTSGYLLRTGTKFIKKPDFKLRGQGLSHPLNGKYIKPEIIFNQYNREILEQTTTLIPGTWQYTYQRSIKDRRYTNLSFNLTFGKQYFLASGFIIDTYAGVGYGLQLINGKKADPNTSEFDDGSDYFPYTNAFGGPEFPITFTFGVKMGMAL